MKALYGIYGASGCGVGIMPVVRAQLGDRSANELVFIDDSAAGQQVIGHEVVDFDAFVSRPNVAKSVAIAIANPVVRRSVAERCIAEGLAFLDVWATNAIRMDDVDLGEGCLVSPFVTFTSRIRIGRHFHANLYSYVEHDCVIGDYVTFAPSVRCNGNVHIGDGAYVGAGALIRQGRPGRPLKIGANAVIGMGAVVTKDVADGATVVGNPARLLRR